MRVAYFDTNVIRDVYERQIVSADILRIPDILLVSEDHLYELSDGLHGKDETIIRSRLNLIQKLLSLPNVRGIERMDKLIANESHALKLLKEPVALPYIDLARDREAIIDRASRRMAGTLTPVEREIIFKRVQDKKLSYLPWINEMKKRNIGMPKIRNIDHLIEGKFVDPKHLLGVIYGRQLPQLEFEFLNKHREKFPHSIVTFMMNLDFTIRIFGYKEPFAHDRLDDARHVVISGESDFITSDQRLITSLQQFGRDNLYTPEDYLKTK